MAYEHIDVSELKSALRKLDNINNNKLKNLTSSINAGDWSGNSRVRIVEALKTVSGYYDSIKSYLEKCKTATDYIDEYKDIAKENTTFNSKIKNIKNSDSYHYYDYKRDAFVFDTQLMNKVNDYNKKINTNNERLKQLQEKINGLLD